MNVSQYVRREVKKILDEKGFYFPKEITLKFTTSKGEVKKIPATKTTEFFERKDVLKIVRLMRK